jgi:hypothetical protein
MRSSVLQQRLALILDWYQGMTSDQTGRLVYSYEPESDSVISNGSAIRDIASIWDMEILGNFLQRPDLNPLIERSIRHYASYIVAQDGALILDSARLRESSGIAHSAFMLLAILDAAPAVDVPRRESTIAGLAEGLLHQQRPDGSYRIYFGDEADEGLEFYPGEAMLALMRAHALTGENRYLRSVEQGFRFFRRSFPADAIAGDLRVFHANWQSQYVGLLHESTPSKTLRRMIREYIFAIHDRVIGEHFYEDIERLPMQQATVEVACALEGLNDAYGIAVREADRTRMEIYERCIRTALTWLLRAQRIDPCTSREKGGFGHSLVERTQRIDVTGHVVGGFIKSVRNSIECVASEQAGAFQIDPAHVIDSPRPS